MKRKNSWYDWNNCFVNYIPKLIKTANILISLFNSNKIVHCSGKRLSEPKTQKESQHKMIKNINLFKLEKENKAIEEKIIGDIKKLF